MHRKHVQKGDKRNVARVSDTEERAVRSRAVMRMAEGEFNRFGLTFRWDVRGFGRVAE